MRDQKKLYPESIFAGLGMVFIFAIFLLSISSSASDSSAEMYYSMGQEYMEKSEFDMAVLAFERAVDLASGWPEAHNALGEAYIQLLRFEDALVQFDKALELKKDYTQAKINRRRTMTSVERYKPMRGSRLSRWHKFAILAGITAVITLVSALVVYLSS
jgi:lipoprotein NlpI